jgi:hypothetical protein
MELSLVGRKILMVVTKKQRTKQIIKTTVDGREFLKSK